MFTNWRSMLFFKCQYPPNESTDSLQSQPKPVVFSMENKLVLNFIGKFTEAKTMKTL